MLLQRIAKRCVARNRLLEQTDGHARVSPSRRRRGRSPDLAHRHQARARRRVVPPERHIRTAPEHDMVVCGQAASAHARAPARGIGMILLGVRGYHVTVLSPRLPPARQVAPPSLVMKKPRPLPPGSRPSPGTRYSLGCRSSATTRQLNDYQCLHELCVARRPRQRRDPPRGPRRVSATAGGGGAGRDGSQPQHRQDRAHRRRWVLTPRRPRLASLVPFTTGAIGVVNLERPCSTAPRSATPRWSTSRTGCRAWRGGCGGGRPQSLNTTLIAPLRRGSVS